MGSQLSAQLVLFNSTQRTPAMQEACSETLVLRGKPVLKTITSRLAKSGKKDHLAFLVFGYLAADLQGHQHRRDSLG